MANISGPLLDRTDLHIEVPAVKYKDLARGNGNEQSSTIARGDCRPENSSAEIFREEGNVLQFGHGIKRYSGILCY